MSAAPAFGLDLRHDVRVAPRCHRPGCPWEQDGRCACGYCGDHCERICRPQRVEARAHTVSLWEAASDVDYAGGDLRRSDCGRCDL